MSQNVTGETVNDNPDQVYMLGFALEQVRSELYPAELSQAPIPLFPQVLRS